MSQQLLGQLADAREQLSKVQHFLDTLEIAAKGRQLVEPEALSEPETGLTDPGAFYDHIRGDAGELFPVMSVPQFQGIEAILKVAAGKLPLSWCAYCLATAYHETARTMQGVREGLSVSDSWRRRNLRYYPWYGRGLVQLTWERNYKFATERLRELGYEGIDLVANPDQALDLEVSAIILVIGMLEGWFTGKKLRDYIPAEPERKHYQNARRIVNAMDKADLIAGYAIEFEKGLKLGGWR